MHTQNIFIKKILDSRSSAEYDCAVMFSGGKDSTYLLYLFKEVYKKKVIAVTVDNGFEDEWIWKQTKELTEKLNVPHVVYDPGKENFKLLFETMIKEYEKFAVLTDVNHICYICNNLLWACTLKFASEKGIPFVISGLDPAQIGIEQEKYEYSTMIAEKVFRKGMNNAREIFKTSCNYNSNNQFRCFIDTVFSFPKNVKTIFPFIYLDYNVEDIKNTVSEQVGWKPPIPIHMADYVTSGCKVAEGLYSIQALEIARPRDKEQIKKLIDDGSANKRVFKAFSKLVGKKQKYINLQNNIFDELEIKEFLIKKCKQLNIKYKVGDVK